MYSDQNLVSSSNQFFRFLGFVKQLFYQPFIILSLLSRWRSFVQFRNHVPCDAKGERDSRACLRHLSPTSLPPLSTFRDRRILKLRLEKLGGPHSPRVVFFLLNPILKKRKKKKETPELVMSLGKVRWMFFQSP